ncbi:MAG: hypothetical protein LBP83_00180 [Dysgonamonadaceae bacterium]|jgi:hypothetical protein|nr:hypothetical protein [Dysgonamonadaceae bacterium]
MEKEKIRMEYVFDNASKNSLWTHIGTSIGLSEWFADEVVDDGKIFTFTWDGHAINAEMTGINPNVYIRFHWLEDENPNSYFEFRLHKNELTGGLMLEITDFAEPEEKEAGIILWDKQVKDLKRLLGL